MVRKSLLSVALVAVVGSSFAQDFTGGAGGAIPDFTGGMPGEISTTITVSEPLGGPIISLNSVTLLGLRHTWAGDVQLSLTHQATGTTVDLVHRAGQTTWNSGFGSNRNYGSDGASPTGVDYVFVQSGGLDVVTTLNGLPGGTSGLPAGTYNRFTHPDSGAMNRSPHGFDVFTGLEINGNWVLTARDYAAGDTGAFDGWQFNATYDPVPEPASLAALSLGALALLRRRRNRK